LILRVFLDLGGLDQGCQMVYFQTKKSYCGKFWRFLDWKMLIYLWPFGMYHGHSGYFMTIWYILCSFGTFSGFGIMHREKSGNPGLDACKKFCVSGVI
jgi:hypothetical protein